jgi:hypothetical protein
MVLTTLHTNDAPGAVARLTTMGIESFLTASAVESVVAQRLARQLCAYCKKRTVIPTQALAEAGFRVGADVEAYEPLGCARCNQTGYRGRIGLRRIRRAVAEADYLRLLDLEAIDALLGRGRAGSATLRRALEHHRPEYARTLSPLEDRLLDLCRSHGMPLPEVNVRIRGCKVDALWRDHRIVVEVDRRAAHGAPARLEQDRGRDLALRAAGYVVPALHLAPGNDPAGRGRR